MAVNWETLDALVIDFAKSESLFEDSTTYSPSSPHQSRLLIRQIRRSLQIGDIDAAMDLLRLHAPSILDDHRILFRLHKQKFIELLRKGTAKDRESAIHCLRTSLAPCALNAYPEAYEEFKHVMLAFIFDKDDQTSPVANEWSERRRFDIAGMMSSSLRAHLQAYEPVLSMTLMYLISIHKIFCFQQGISSPIADLTKRLLFEERDLPATPQEILLEAPPFDEVDIQALIHAVEITRQGAVDSLRFAKGNLYQAFQNELCLMKLDISMLDELVQEYCIYRGVVYPGFASPSAPGLHSISETLKVHQPESWYCASRSWSYEMDHETNKHLVGETSIGNAHTVCSRGISSDGMSRQTSDVEVRYPCEATSDLGDCSTSGTHVNENSRVLQRNRSTGIGGKSGRKRWRGRQDALDFWVDAPGNEISQKEDSATTLVANTNMFQAKQVSKEHSTHHTFRNHEDKYELVLGMKELVNRGMAAEVVEEVNAMDPDFFVQNPVLLFQLKQVEFLKLVAAGDLSGARRVACAHLGPLAAADEALLKPLKETLMTLLGPYEDALSKGISLHALATSLQVAIGRKLGIDEPQLVKIMRVTLHTHTEWFRLQMCKDRFEEILQIDSLKEVSAPLIGDVASKSNAGTSTQGSSQVTVSSGSRIPEDGNSPNQVSSSDVTDEAAILKVMDFLALSRADAIHLLGQYNGNPEAVIQQLFA